MARDFEDHCWKDVVSSDVLKIYEPYRRDVYVGDRPALLAIDLYKPNCIVRAVNIVSRDKLVILLEEDGGNFFIQWHRIPTSPIGHRDRPPPPKPPGVRVSTEKRKRARLERWGCYDSDEEETTSYDYRKKYEFWPCQDSLIQADEIGRSDHGNALIASDGRGFLVTLVKNAVTIWLVSSMEKVRQCNPFAGLPFSNQEEDAIGNLTMHTDVYPIEDSLGPGEGSYYGKDRNRDILHTKRSGTVQGSKNPIDLAQADTQTILSRFSHLTFDEQRNFERGHCGLNAKKEAIKRNAKMKGGSCSPQLECVVRVAFVLNKTRGEEQRYIIHCDLKPFHHLRHRESTKTYPYANHVKPYEKSCLGQYQGVWLNNHDVILQTHDECCHVLEWRRGGVFDFPVGGPCERERENRIDRLIEDTMQGDTELDHYPELRKEIHAYNSITERTYNYRAITSLFIDQHKLIVSTSSEITILPFSLYPPSIPEDINETTEAWRMNFGRYASTYSQYLIDKGTEVHHSFRPLDAALISRWNKIRDFANFAASGNTIMSMFSGTPLPIATLPEPNRVNSIETITADLAQSMSKEEELLDASESERVSMWFPLLSWRYLTVVSSALTEKDHGNERLNVFDVLATWENAGRSRVLKNGIHFNDDLEEGAEQEDEDSNSDSESSYY